MPYANLPPNTPFGPDWQMRALLARNGYANSVTSEVARLLVGFYTDLQDRLESGVDFAPQERQRLQSLTSWARVRLEEIIPRANYLVELALRKAGPIEQGAQYGEAEALRALTNVPSRAQLIATADYAAVVRNADIGGIKFGEWWKRDAESALMRIKRTVQSDILEGFGPRQVASRVFRGTDGRAGLGDVQLHNVRTMVRTTMTSVSSEAARIEQNEMRDVISKVRFSAISDARTSKICLRFADKTYTVGDQKIPQPPLHPNCRSSLEPIPDLSALGLSPDALGKRVTMDEWMRLQSPETQNDSLGVANARRFRSDPKLGLAALLASDKTVLNFEKYQATMLKEKAA